MLIKKECNEQGVLLSIVGVNNCGRCSPLRKLFFFVVAVVFGLFLFYIFQVLDFFRLFINFYLFIYLFIYLLNFLLVFVYFN